LAKVEKSQIEAMRSLGFTQEEIDDVIKCDEQIDKGAKLFELSPEQEKASKKARNAGTRKTPPVYKLDNTGGQRSRKENPTKGSIIAELAKFLTENSENAYENVEITNKERQIAFKIGENDFTFSLTQHRKK